MTVVSQKLCNLWDEGRTFEEYLTELPGPYEMKRFLWTDSSQKSLNKILELIEK